MDWAPASVTMLSSKRITMTTCASFHTTRGRPHASWQAGGLHAGPRVAPTSHTAASLGSPWMAATRRRQKSKNQDQKISLVSKASPWKIFRHKRFSLLTSRDLFWRCFRIFSVHPSTHPVLPSSSASLALVCPNARQA